MGHTKSLCGEPEEHLLRLPSLRLWIQRAVDTLTAAAAGVGLSQPAPHLSEAGWKRLWQQRRFVQSLAVMPCLQLCFLNLNLLHRVLLCLKACPLSTCLPSQSLHKQKPSQSLVFDKHLPGRCVGSKKCCYDFLYTREPEAERDKVNSSSLALWTG